MLKMAVKADLRSRFQGCLAGAVAGDCLGAPYEISGVSAKPFQQLTEFFQGLGTDRKSKLGYTDDTAMARSIAQSLVDNQGKFNSKDLAKKFAAEYKSQPTRGYGGNVITVLQELGDEDLKDVFEPARGQFDGSGSYGNGGAMRVAPAALCPESDFDQVIEVARQSAQLTHSNALGYNGAILQCCAVHLALHSDPATFDPDAFIDRLLSVMETEEAKNIAKEKEDDEMSPPSKVSRTASSFSRQFLVNKEYSRKIRLMKTLLAGDADIETVAFKLGNQISAHKSVPAAIYSFLRCRTPVEGIPFSGGVERTILYAISLDGDTDTIASMAGAIAGAYYGMEAVPKEWMEWCEGADHAVKQADSLYDIHYGQQ